MSERVVRKVSLWLLTPPALMFVLTLRSLSLLALLALFSLLALSAGTLLLACTLMIASCLRNHFRDCLNPPSGRKPTILCQSPTLGQIYRTCPFSGRQGIQS